MSTGKVAENLTFDHYTLRLFVGGIALFFPWVVTVFAFPVNSSHLALLERIPSSISASYYTNARDIFVGCLAVIGILLIGYKGHTPVLPREKVGPFWQWVGKVSVFLYQQDLAVPGRKHEEDLVSTIGGLAAFFVALCPTACDTCHADMNATIHYVAAGVLFSTVVYFCFFAFLRSVNSKLGLDEDVFTFLRATKKVQVKDKKKVLRGRVYVTCGSFIALTMLGLFVVQSTAPEITIKTLRITFWGEAVALCLFGIAWITACQFPGMLDKDEEK